MGSRSARPYASLAGLTLFIASAVADVPARQTGASDHAAQVVQAPITADRQTWRRRMAQTPRSKKGCFFSTYPQTTWREIQCAAPPQRPLLPRSGRGGHLDTVGNVTGDYSSLIAGDALMAEGSFDSVSGVTSEIGGGVPDAYSLQLNTNTFATATCSGGNTGCQGWEQFVFFNMYVPGLATAFIQYWLINHGSPCPAGWATYDNGTEVDCWRNAPNGLNIFSPLPTIAALGEQAVIGSAASGSADDSATFSIGDLLYSVTGANYFPDLGQHWNAAEFNVFGPGNDSEAIFNTGSTIVVRTAMNSGTAAPSCALESFTGETNNLTLASTPNAESGSQWPSIVFTESNAGNSSTAGCSATGVTPVSATATTIESGQSATLTVQQTGAGPFTYQWYASTAAASGAPISGATGSRLTVTPGATTSYFVQITGPGGLADYGQTITITVEQSVPTSDGPLPLWAVSALGAALFALSSRALANQRLRVR